MAKSDGEVRISTKIDTTEAKKNLKELETATKETGEKIEESTSGFKSMGAAAVAGAAVAVGAVKKLTDALDKCTQAYKVQEKAEKTLANAAKNNPYLSGESVNNLKKFASELQNVSEIGDETSISIMATLAATGRTEEQIMSIMKASADMAAVTGQDVASVAQTLNATYNGVTGTIGRQIAEVRNLTKEELEHGKAVEIIAEKYKDAATTTADLNVQLQNAWGDLQEKVGKAWNDFTAPARAALLDILETVNDGIEKSQYLARNASLTQQLTTEALKVKDSFGYFKYAFEQWDNDAMEAFGQYVKEIEEGTANTANLTEKQQGLLGNMVNAYKVVNRYRVAAAEEEKKILQTQQEEAERLAKLKEEEETRNNYIKQNADALEQELAVRELRARLNGEEVDAQETYNTILESYINLITKSNGMVDESNDTAKERLSLLDQWKAKADETAEAEKRIAEATERQAQAQKTSESIISSYDSMFYTGLTEKLRDYNTKYKTVSEALANEESSVKQAGYEIELNMLDEMLEEEFKLNTEYDNKTYEATKEALRERINLLSNSGTEGAKALKASLQDQMQALDEANEKYNNDKWLNHMKDNWLTYADYVTSIVSNIATVIGKEMERSAEESIKTLEDEYAQGLKTEDEYNEELKRIRKESAADQYKANLAIWLMQLSMATANGAAAVLKAYTEGGIVYASLVGTAAAAQIATIVASRPSVPAYKDGGIIGSGYGASYGEDNTFIKARKGEMVINAIQQRALWDMISGEGSGMNVVINNTQSDKVMATTENRNGKLVVSILEKHINKGLANGRYNNGLAGAISGMNGMRYI